LVTALAICIQVEQVGGGSMAKHGMQEPAVSDMSVTCSSS
jgi:hypothetical protein